VVARDDYQSGGLWRYAETVRFAYKVAVSIMKRALKPMSTGISDRPFALGVVMVLAASLAACGQSSTANQSALADAETQARSKAADDGKIDCMPAGETAFLRACDIERGRDDDGAMTLIIRHPDGGFRRLLIANDGRGVIAADGAEQAVVTTISPREIEVALGGNRYRLPATVKPGAAAATQ
jgi:hypothetical protein